jgi:hypothetical protein
MDNRVIIGVVGSDLSPTIGIAAAVGAEVVRQGHILLTGGKPGAGGTKVKDAAMDGAINVEESTIARMIGILDNREPPQNNCRLITTINPSSRYLLVYTGLTNHERNVINGVTPDVMIALEGREGTLSEIAFASFAGVPVVFLSSLEALIRRYKTEQNEFMTVLRNAQRKYPIINGEELEIDKLNEGFLSYLESWIGKPEDIARVADIQEGAVRAVRQALTSHSSTPPKFTKRFPGVPGCQVDADQFYNLVSQIAV